MSVHLYVRMSIMKHNAATKQVVVFVKVNETFTTIWLSRSSEVRVKVRRWPQSPIGTIFQSCWFTAHSQAAVWLAKWEGFISELLKVIAEEKWSWEFCTAAVDLCCTSMLFCMICLTAVNICWGSKVSQWCCSLIFTPGSMRNRSNLTDTWMLYQYSLLWSSLMHTVYLLCHLKVFCIFGKVNVP